MQLSDEGHERRIEALTRDLLPVRGTLSPSVLEDLVHEYLVVASEAQFPEYIGVQGVAFVVVEHDMPFIADLCTTSWASISVDPSHRARPTRSAGIRP